jgi:hypothetical protein
MTTSAAESIRLLIAAAPRLDDAQVADLRALIHNQGGRRAQRPTTQAADTQATAVAAEPRTTGAARTSRAATSSRAEDEPARRDRPAVRAVPDHSPARGLTLAAT